MFGLIGAILGGLVGIIPWIILGYFGYVATFGGIAIVLGAQYGHNLLGGKPGKGRMAAVIFVTIAMVFVANAASITLDFAISIADGSLAQSWDVPASCITMSDLWPIISENVSYPPFQKIFLQTLV